MARGEFFDVLNGKTSTTMSPSDWLQAIERRSVYIIRDSESPTAFTPGGITQLWYLGRMFRYDPADATTAHDGVTCIVTSDGKRFKTDAWQGRSITRWSVKDKDLNTPPGSPVLGDQYVINTAPTGAWAGQAKKIATFTARGWVFIAPNAFDEAYVQDEAAIYHYSSGAVWTAGMPGITLAASSVKPTHVKYASAWAVENQTTNTPPGSPSEGVSYVVGPSPTAAWVGQAGKVSSWESGAWVFYTPVEGRRVWDKSLDQPLFREGSAWISPFASSLQLIGSLTVAGASIAFSNIPTGFRELVLYLLGVSTANDGGGAQVQVSVNNGSSYLTGWFGRLDGDNPLDFASSGAQVLNGIGAAETFNALAILEDYAAAGSNLPRHIHGAMSEVNRDETGQFDGWIEVSGAINAIQLAATGVTTFDGGGTAFLYGRR